METVRSSMSATEVPEPDVEAEDQLSLTVPSDTQPAESVAFVVVGASGDLAKKKTYPALLRLFLAGLLPAHLKIWGYARSPMTDDNLRSKLRPFLDKYASGRGAELQQFLDMLVYHKGQYGSDEDFAELNAAITAWEAGSTAATCSNHNRIYYLAVPPSVFAAAAGSIKSSAMAVDGWTRVVIEKPFGHDLDSFRELDSQLQLLLKEHQMFRIDHYLGKEMVQVNSAESLRPTSSSVILCLFRTDAVLNLCFHAAESDDIKVCKCDL
eukprot:SAG31_NODE_264_length_18835_cov_7.543553_10_plen_267_part_00